MGWLFRDSKPAPELPDKPRCCECGKRIRRGDRYAYMDGKLYCESCAEWEDLLDWMMIMEDD